MHSETKGNFTGAQIPKLPGGETPGRLLQDIPPTACGRVISPAWGGSPAARWYHNKLNSSRARVSRERRGVKSQAAEVRKVHATMLAVRLLQEFPSCLVELRTHYCPCVVNVRVLRISLYTYSLLLWTIATETETNTHFSQLLNQKQCFTVGIYSIVPHTWNNILSVVCEVVFWCIEVVFCDILEPKILTNRKLSFKCNESQNNHLPSCLLI